MASKSRTSSSGLDFLRLAMVPTDVFVALHYFGASVCYVVDCLRKECVRVQKSSYATMWAAGMQRQETFGPDDGVHYTGYRPVIDAAKR